jgi:RNA polymerase sigma-70 factor (ECF subfamily)
MGDGSDDFEELFRRLYPSTVSLARRILGSETEAEDAAAEAWARALAGWWRIGRLDHREAWVQRVTANVAIDAVRRRRSSPAPAATPLSPEDAAAVRVTMVAALRALPRRQREVIVLQHLAGLSREEVAGALHISTTSVKTHAARALAHLRGLGLGEEAVS